MLLDVVAGNPDRIGFGNPTYLNSAYCRKRPVCDAGVDGILPHYARQLSDAASSMCACLKTLLQLHQPQADGQPPPKRAKRSVNDGTPQVHDPASEQGQLLQRPHQQQQQQERALQRIQPSDRMQQQQQQQQQQIQDPPMVRFHTGTSLTQLPSHAEPTLAKGLPHTAQTPAKQEAVPEGVQEAALEGAQEAAQAVGNVWQLLMSIGTGSEQELHRLLIQQCREEDVQAPPDFRLADEPQLATLGARADFNAAGVSPSGKGAAQSWYSTHMLNATQCATCQHECSLSCVLQHPHCTGAALPAFAYKCLQMWKWHIIV